MRPVQDKTGKAGMGDPIIISRWPVIFECHGHSKFVINMKCEHEMEQHRDMLMSLRLPQDTHALAAREGQKGSLGDSSTISKVGQAAKDSQDAAEGPQELGVGG